MITTPTAQKTYNRDPMWLRAENILFTDYLCDPDKKKGTTIFTANNRDTSLPIVIDYGSGMIKAVI